MKRDREAKKVKKREKREERRREIDRREMLRDFLFRSHTTTKQAA